jgi:hypothetical protein
LGSRAVLERLVMLHEVEADAVDAMGSVDGSLDFALAAVESIEEGEGDGGIVLSHAVAHAVEGVTEGRVASLGEVADSFRSVAGAVRDGVVACEGPDLGGAVEAMDGADACEVGGSVHVTEAWDGGEVAGRGLRDERDEAATAILDEGFGGDVLLEEAMELLGQGSGDVRREKDSVVGPGAEDTDGGRAATTDFLAVEGEELLIADGLEVVGVGAVDE